MERQILHIDCNKFYSGVECLLHPELRNKPVAVGGSSEDRHGIILTKNEIASKYNLTVGEPLWKARQKCPDLVILQPNFPLYVEYSKKVKRIFEDYTDLIEPYGLDECWLDVTGDIRKTGREIGFEIKERVKNEIGITVSVGLSFNKVFAKLGSDYKKPDAMTVISRKNFKDIVWPLPCTDMIMAGNSTAKKLNNYGIYTIGDLAKSDEKFIKSILGKNGVALRKYAKGEDSSPVTHMNYCRNIKSIGNSTTTPRDLYDRNDVKIVFTALGEKVSSRMRKLGLKASTLSISVKDCEFNHFTRQCKLQEPTNISIEIIRQAEHLFDESCLFDRPIRSLGLNVSNFGNEASRQYDFAGTKEKREKLEKLDKAVDSIRKKYGDSYIHYGLALQNKEIWKNAENHISTLPYSG